MSTCPHPKSSSAAYCPLVVTYVIAFELLVSAKSIALAAENISGPAVFAANGIRGSCYDA